MLGQRQVFFRQHQVVLQIQHLQIGIHHTGNHGELHGIATELAGQQGGPRHITAIAKLPPQVQLVAGTHGGVVTFTATAFAEYTAAAAPGAQSQGREQGRTSLTELRIRLLDPRRRRQQIRIGRQRLVHQLIQFRTVELLPPLRVMHHGFAGLLLVKPLCRHALFGRVQPGLHGAAG